MDRKVYKEIAMRKKMNLRIRRVFFSLPKPDLPPCWDFAVFRNIFIFESEREKVRSDVWRWEEELMQDRRGAIMTGKRVFLYSVSTTLMKYLQAI